MIKIQLLPGYRSLQGRGGDDPYAHATATLVFTAVNARKGTIPQ